jgi:uncharacterized oxidoreductase
MQNRVKAVKPAKGFDEVFTPGDLERKTRLDREENGIPLPDEVWQDLENLAIEVGVSIS